MKRKTWTALAVLGASLAVAPGRAAAQGFGQFGRQPQGRPAVSPFLNLARPGSAGINYYGLVRPQIDTRSAIQQLQQQDLSGYPAGYVGPVTDRAALAGPPSTGHPVRFGNYGRYFSNLGTGQAVVPPAFAPRATLVGPGPFLGAGYGGFGFGPAFGFAPSSTFGFGGSGAGTPSIGVFVRP